MNSKYKIKNGVAVFPEGMTDIDIVFKGNAPPPAFQHCNRLSAINLPDGLKEIGKDAFGDCPGDMLAALKKSVKTYPDCVFGVYIE